MFEITSLTLGKPDSDGDIQPQITVAVHNLTKRDMLLVKTRGVLLNQAGAAIAEVADSTETRIDVDSSDSFSFAGHYFPCSLLARSRERLTGRFHITGYARELFRFETLPLPEPGGKGVRVQHTADSTVLAPALQLIATRTSLDSDGDGRILFRLGVTNVGACDIDAVTLYAELLDRDGAFLKRTETTTTVRRGETAVLADDFYVKARTTRGASMRATLAVFVPLHTATCEVLSRQGR